MVGKTKTFAALLELPHHMRGGSGEESRGLPLQGLGVVPLSRARPPPYGRVLYGRSRRRPVHIAHVLNHLSVTHNTVTAIYDRYRYDKEKRAALEKWAEVLSGIVDVKPAPTTAPARRARGRNVYEFKARGRRTAGRAVEQVSCAPPHSA